MKEDINIWLFPIQEEILVTDQTGGVPIDCCNLPKHYSDTLERLTGSQSVLYTFDDWNKAVNFADSLLKKLQGWTVKYDNWYGRVVESEQENY
jgi:hypothetical protein